MSDVDDYHVTKTSYGEHGNWAWS